jgi:hypothetical protein
VLGAERSLDAALAAWLVAFGLFGLAGARAGWSAGPDLWRWALVATALCAWAAVLVPWRLRHGAYSQADHQRGMYRALGAWAVTDIAVLLAWGT